jgi:hypothetical protein
VRVPAVVICRSVVVGVMLIDGWLEGDCSVMWFLALCHMICAPGHTSDCDPGYVVLVLAYYVCCMHVCIMIRIYPFLFLFGSISVTVEWFLRFPIHVCCVGCVKHRRRWDCYF